jgi:putative Holliday junction resolvase
MSLICLDVGDKRIGVALSHSEVLSSEYATIENKEDVFTKIGEICQKEDAEKIIVGLPIPSKTAESEQTKKVKIFADELGKIINLPIILENETLTTSEALQILQDEGLTVEEAKVRVDQLSAKLILQQYLEGQTQPKSEENF